MLNKIDILKAFLNADQDKYQELIDHLHRFAKSSMGGEGGLPTFDEESNKIMAMIIGEWIYKFIVNLE